MIKYLLRTEEMLLLKKGKYMSNSEEVLYLIIQSKHFSSSLIAYHVSKILQICRAMEHFTLRTMQY